MLGGLVALRFSEDENSRGTATARERGVAPLLGVVVCWGYDHGSVERRCLGEVTGDRVGVRE